MCIICVILINSDTKKEMNTQAITNTDALSEVQKQFLKEFLRDGDLNASLERVGIDMVLYLSWRKTKLFDSRFKEVRSLYFSTLREMARDAALKNMYEAIEDGFITEKKVERTKIWSEKLQEFVENSRITITQKEVPFAYYKEFLGANKLEEAINQLMVEGAITQDQARDLVSISEEAAQRSQDVFNKTNEDDKQISDRKAIAILKTAIMGAMGDGDN